MHVKATDIYLMLGDHCSVPLSYQVPVVSDLDPSPCEKE